MELLGNIIWFLFGGFIGGLVWMCVGTLWCLTIVGLPIGMQCFKFAKLVFFPFGKEIEYGNSSYSFLINLLWIVLFGWEMCIGYLCIGVLFCCTIIGIPFGKQFFKLSRLSLLPFGAEVVQ